MRGLCGWAVVALGSLVLAPVGTAEVRLMNLFTDRMVLQMADAVPIWGWADADEAVTVSFAGQTVKTVTGADGRWQVTLRGLEYGGPHELAVSGSTKTITRKDVLVGEVWITSGQSNMGPLGSTTFGEDFVATANYPNLRWAGLHPSDEAGENHDNVRPVYWGKAEKENKGLRHWSAVATYFGLEIHQRLGVPVGMVQHARGGTPAESWMRLETLQSRPLYADLLARYEETRAKYPALKTTYDAEMTRWTAAGKPADSRPRMPRELRTTSWPTYLYRNLHEPIAPMANRGFLFYQGESNAGRAWQYRTLLPDLIKDWRDLWEDPARPFIVVQIATSNGKPLEGDPKDSRIGELHEAQSLTAAADPNVGISLTYDLPEPSDDVHYRHKRPAGERAGLVALGMVYGEDVVYQGPRYASMQVEGGSIRLRFAHAEGGLQVKGDTLGGFAIAGADRVFKWAEARVEGEVVIVRHAAISQPVAVRFAWADQPVGANLYNRAGLPAEPFRTDDWPMITRDAR